MGFFKKLWGKAKRTAKTVAKTGLKIGKTLYNNREKILNVANKGLAIGESVAAMIPGEGTAIAGGLEAARRGVSQLESGVRKSEKIVHMGEKALDVLKPQKRAREPEVSTTVKPTLISHPESTNQSMDRPSTPAEQPRNSAVYHRNTIRHSKRRRVNRV